MEPPPKPPAMQTHFTKPSPMMSNSPHQSLSSGSNPPTPPTRRHSLRGNGGVAGGNGSSSHTGETFESRFSNLFKSPQYLPPPEPFTQCAKTYPSRSQQQSFSGGRQGSRRAPAPPPPPQKGAPPPPPAAQSAWSSQPVRG